MGKGFACLSSIYNASSLRRLRIFVSVLFIQLGLISAVHAAEPPDFTLVSDTWHQMSIPGNSMGLTIESLFGDDLPASEYNESWTIYLWDSSIQQYVNPGLSGSIPAGHGFWMFQTTGSPVTLDVPDVGSVTTNTSPACSTGNGCSEVPLASNSNADLYNMVGSALPKILEVDAIRLVSESADGLCEDGCSHNVAAELDLVGQSLWHYDSALGSYRDLSETGTLNPWESFWVLAKSELAGTDTSYLFPASPADPPDVDLLGNIDSAGNLDTRDTSENLPAFPGATGHGWLSTGGRGGEVYCVNTLDDVSEAGDGLLSFREVAEAIGDVPNGPRNLTFCVSGQIDTGTEPVQILDSNLSILGQTAPAPGVVLVGYRALDFDNNADDIIVRHIDSKPKDTLNAGLNTAQRNVTIGGGPGIAPDNMIFDHMSMQGSTDDTFTVFVNNTTNTTVPGNITVSHSIMGEGDTTCRRSDFECGSASTNGGVQQPYSFPNHSMAAQVSSGNGTAIKDVAFVANVMGNTVARSPQLRSVSVGEVVNNMMFNVYGIVVLFGQKPGSAPSNGYIIGNTIKHGPDTVLPAERQFLLSGGNYAVSGNTQIERDGTVTREFESNGVTTITAGPRTTLQGNNQLNISCVGASVPVRDSWDARMIAEMNGTGTDPVLDSAEVGIGPRVGPVWMPGDSRVNRFYEPGIDDQGQRDWSTYVGSNSHPTNYDTDNDGIADSFENDVIALDPNDNFDTLADIDHTTVHPDGYTYFEKWTNNLAASCATGG